MNNVPDRICEIIADIAGMEVAAVKPTSQLVADLAMDSLDQVELIMELEEEFDINIPDELAEGHTTVQDVITALERRLTGEQIRDDHASS